MTAAEFTDWAKMFQDRMYRMAKVILGDSVVAKDAVQDVFLKIWQKRHLLSRIGNHEAWCIELTKNRCLDLFKKISKERMVKKNDNLFPLSPIKPDEYAIGKDLSKQLSIIIEKLSPVQKAILQLRESEQMDYETISQALNISVANIKINVFRSRQFIREELKKYSTYENRD